MGTALGWLGARAQSSRWSRRGPGQVGLGIPLSGSLRARPSCPQKSLEVSGSVSLSSEMGSPSPTTPWIWAGGPWAAPVGFLKADKALLVSTGVHRPSARSWLRGGWAGDHGLSPVQGSLVLGTAPPLASLSLAEGLLLGRPHSLLSGLGSSHSSCMGHGHLLTSVLPSGVTWLQSPLFPQAQAGHSVVPRPH